jgi:para-aminobenzoate synthetase component 1
LKTAHDDNGTGSGPETSRLFLRHRGKRYGFVLQSERTPSGAPALAFAGSDPVGQLVIEKSGDGRLWNGRSWRPMAGDPVKAVEAFIESSQSAPLAESSAAAKAAVLPRTVGYLSYELGAFIEDVPTVRVDAVGLPLAVLSTYDEIDVAGAGPDIETVRFSDAAGARVVPAGSVRPAPTYAGAPGSHEKDAALAAYDAGFARITDAIRVGEIYQANLTRRLVFEYDGDAYDLWRRLTEVQPVPFAAFLDFGEAALLGNSPERFLRVRGDRILTCPIKGTRPRSTDDEIDAALVRELADDAKEAAEHVMIVDLERNDLGRVCEPATVVVENLASVSSYSTVHHLESEVRGQLRPGAGFADILSATFPGGSITGAPKIKAMEIIAEVEPEARGVYTGAVGWCNGGREVELNVAIRTAVAAGGRVHYGVGGGIVADSRMDKELDETMTKARAMVEAIERSEREQRVTAS